MTDLAENTTLQRGIPLTMAALRNVHRAQRVPHWSDLGPTLRGRRAFIVGAGPSLDESIGRLREHLAGDGSGSVVIAVNGSAPALARAGVRVDVIVVIECVGQEAQLRAGVRTGDELVVLSLQAAPETWAVAESIGAPTAWLASDSPEALEWCEMIDVPSLPTGGAAVTEATALARAWGAGWIVLLGHDLSFTDGRAYAQGAGWGGLEVSITEGVATFTGRGDRELAHRRAGVPAVPRERPIMWRPGIGGGNVATVADYWHQAKWYEARAEEWRGYGEPYLRNATSRGLALRWWWEDEDSSWGNRYLTTRRWTRPHVTVAGREDAVRAAIDEALTRIDASEALAEAALRGDRVAGLAGCYRGSIAVETLVAPDIIGMKRAGLPAHVRVEALYHAYKSAAKMAREALEEGA